MPARQPYASVPELGQRLRHFRRLRRRGEGGTLKEFAAASGLSVSFVSLVERGQREPQLRTLVRMAQVLNVSLCDLFSPLPSLASPLMDPREGAIRDLVAFLRTSQMPAARILKLARVAAEMFPPASAAQGGRHG